MARFLFVIFILLIANPCFSQIKNNNGTNDKIAWEKNGIIINDSQGRSTKQNAKLVSLSDGSCVIVWEDARNGFADIYAQKLDAEGKRLWGENGIAVCQAPLNQTFPQVIDSGNSTVIISWQDYRSENSDIYIQKIGAAGNTLWNKDGIPVCKASANQLVPQLVSDGNGGAIVAWYDYRAGIGEDIYAQKISKSGISEWAADGVPVCTEEGTQWYPQIVADGGGAIICWDDKRSGLYDIYAQKLDASGTSQWQANGISICDAPDNQEFCQIVLCSNESFVITWQDYRNGNADIFAQMIDETGRIFWKSNGIAVCETVGNQERPQVIGGESPVIVWTDYRNGTGNSDIYCQKVSSSGKLLWDIYGNRVCNASGNQANPRIATDNENGAVVTWQDLRTSVSGIYAARITNDGRSVWGADGKSICNGKDSSEFPQVSSSRNGNTIITWQDKRRGNLDVYSQSVNSSGSTLWKNNGVGVAVAFGAVTQQRPKIARVNNDEYIVTFEDFRNGYSNIYAQKFNNSGKLLWEREGVRICNFSNNQSNPELVSDDDGGAIIVFEDMRAGISQIYAQRIDPFGNLLWDEFGILLAQVEKDKKNPKITKDSKGGAIIVWQDFRSGKDLPDIYAQKIDKNGAVLWGNEGICINNSGGVQTNIKIDSDGEGGCIVTWVDYRKNINTPDIYAQRISSSGNILWDLAGLAVCRAPETQRNQDVGLNGDIIVAWEDSGGGGYDIYAQKISKSGTVVWACDGIPVCTDPFTQQGPKLLVNDDGGAIITWDDYRNANWDIFIQRVDPSGKLLWQKNGVPVCTAIGTQYSPKIAKSKNEASILVWEDYRNNKNYNIYAQKISDKGAALWEKDGMALCEIKGGARNPEVADDGRGGAIIVWTDYRDGSYDIYAQRINED